MPGTQCGCARREKETEREREISRLARHSDIVINEQELEEREVEFVWEYSIGWCDSNDRSSPDKINRTIPFYYNHYYYYY